MATLDYDIPTELITVQLPDLLVDLQEVWDQTAEFLSSFRAMSTPNFMFAGGKDDLGGGLRTAISLSLVDWLIRFAAQGGPAFVATEISGGNLIGKVGSLQGAAQDPVDPAAFTFIKLVRSTDASIVETGVSGLTAAESQALSDIDVATGDTLDQIKGAIIVDRSIDAGGWVERHFVFSTATPLGTEVGRYELQAEDESRITNTANPESDPPVPIDRRVPITFP